MLKKKKVPRFFDNKYVDTFNKFEQNNVKKPHSGNDLGSNLCGVCMLFLCLGFLMVLWFPPTAHRHAG